MTVKINADTSDGLKFVSDTSGAIDFQSNGSTKMSMDSSGNLTCTSMSGIHKPQIFHVRDEKGTLVHGGSAGANTDNIRVLNTVKTNEITGASLSSNQITLPAGTYFCEAFANGCMVDHHRAFLYNVTDSSVELIGQQYFATAFSNLGDNTSMILGRFTITGQKVFELRHRTQSAKADIGLGHYMNDTRNSVYADVIITRVA